MTTGRHTGSRTGRARSPKREGATKQAGPSEAALAQFERFAEALHGLLSLPALPDREARRRVPALRRQIRSEPGLAATFMKTPPPRAGRPQGRKLDIAGAVLFIAVDVMKCSKANALRAIGRGAESASKNYRWLNNHRDAWSRALKIVPEPTRTALEKIAEVLPKSLDGHALDGAGMLKTVHELKPSLFA